MHWLFAQLYLILWTTAVLYLVVSLVKMFKREIIGKGEFSHIMLYFVTIATLAAYLTPQLEEPIRYCAKLLFVAELLAVFFDYRKNRR
jgi:hypothetical protein